MADGGQQTAMDGEQQAVIDEHQLVNGGWRSKAADEQLASSENK